MIDELIRVAAPTLTPSSSTELSMWAPGPTVTPRPSTVRPPTMRPRRHEQSARDQRRRDHAALDRRAVDERQLREPPQPSPTSVLTSPSRMSNVACR